MGSTSQQSWLIISKKKKKIFTDMCILVWSNPQMRFWLCEHKNILFYTVCKSNWLSAGALVRCHQTFFLISVVAVHSWWHLKSFQQYIHPKLLIFQDSRIWCSKIFWCSNSSKLVWRAIWFRHRSCVLNVFKLLELEFANSWMVWRRTFETLNSRIWFKEIQIEFERCKERHFWESLKQRSLPCESQQKL